MKVSLTRGGGLAGTVVTIVVDTGGLDDDTAAELRDRVRACRFDTDEPTATGADRMRSELRVDSDGRVAQVRFDEGAAPAGAHALVAWLLESPHAERSVGRAT